jgi:hypothetical protein
MHQRLHDLLIAAPDETVGIQCELMLPGFFGSAGKPIRRKISSRMCPPLIGDEHVRQRAIEQRRVKMIVRLLQAAVFDRRDRFLSFVRAKFPIRLSSLCHDGLPCSYDGKTSRVRRDVWLLSGWNGDGP